MKINCGYELFHIWGPLSIHSYGLFIVLGIIISTTLARRNKRFTQLHLEHCCANIVTVAIIAGIFGGRVLEVISSPQLYPTLTHIFAIWDGGFSILGSILGVITLVPLYLKIQNIPIIPLFDLAAIYAPLLQSIARLGCFTAGCCYGIATQSWCSVTYTNPETIAPVGLSMHPTQLYSSALLMLIFFFMFFFAQYRFTKTGQLFSLYLILVSLERFIVDFWRADRIMFATVFSFHQLVALGIISSVFLFQAILWIYNRKKRLLRV